MITVEVTQEDIDHDYLSEKHLLPNCPLATAISRAIGQTAGVGLDDWWVENTEMFHRLPSKAKTFRNDYDQFGPKHVKPFTFVLRAMGLRYAKPFDLS